MALSKKRKFSHNKKRNSGLVYEFLLRKISECLLEKDVRGSKKALNIIKKYYSKGSPLSEEKQLFDIIIGTRDVSNRVASGILIETANSAKSFSFRMLDIKKSNLIKEINHTFGKSFFSSFAIEDYKAFASVQLFINGCNPKSSLVESVQRVKLEESLINFMMSSEKKAVIDEYAQVDDLTYGIAVKKFNERYGSTLNESQKNLLSSYINSLSSKNGKQRLTCYLNKQRSKLLEFLKRSHLVKEITSDKLILEKLSNAELKLESMEFEGAGQKEIEGLMLYCKLVEEISSNE